MAAVGAAGLYGAGAGYGAGMAGAGYGGLAGLGGLSMLYSTSFLYAGFVGLGALWAALYFGGYGGGGGGGGYGGGGYAGHGGYGGYRGGYGGYGGGGGYGGYRGGYGRDYGGGSNSYPTSSYSNIKGGKGKGHVHTNDCHHKRKRRSAGHEIWMQDGMVLQDNPYTSISLDYLDESNLHIARNNPRKIVDEVHSSLQSTINSRNFWEMSYKEPEEEHLLRTIRDSDTDNCGLRLVCELAAVRDRPLTREEWEILRFVRQGDELYNKVYPGQGVGPNSSALRDYKEAEHFGKRGGACAKRFERCRVGADHMMAMITGLRRL